MLETELRGDFLKEKIVLKTVSVNQQAKETLKH